MDKPLTATAIFTADGSDAVITLDTGVVYRVPHSSNIVRAMDRAIAADGWNRTGWSPLGGGRGSIATLTRSRFEARHAER